MTNGFRTSVIITDGEERTRAVARSLATHLRGGELIALDGPLGAGKTTFVRGLAEGLGLDPVDVSSPTFVLCHEYGEPGSTQLIHIDAYRLQDIAELETFGFDELVAAPQTIVVIEWASRIEAALPDDRIGITLDHLGPSRRSISITGPASVVDMLVSGSQGQTQCVVCNTPVSGASEHFPFCSARCRMADLGRWFLGSYRIMRPLAEQDIDD